MVYSGQENNTAKDKVNHVSGQVFKGNTRVTSVRAYTDGRVVYSKDEYNDAQFVAVLTIKSSSSDSYTI